MDCQKNNQMDEIIFTNNWNNKLDCDCYTTIRLQNAQKYVHGRTYKISFVKKSKNGNEKTYLHDAVIVGIRTMTIDKINDFMAYIDTGYDAIQCRNIIRNMYKKSNLDWNRQMISFILLKKIKKHETRNHSSKQ